MAALTLWYTRRTETAPDIRYGDKPVVSDAASFGLVCSCVLDVFVLLKLQTYFVSPQTRARIANPSRSPPLVVCVGSVGYFSSFMVNISYPLILHGGIFGTSSGWGTPALPMSISMPLLFVGALNPGALQVATISSIVCEVKVSTCTPCFSASAATFSSRCIEYGDVSFSNRRLDTLKEHLPWKTSCHTFSGSPRRTTSLLPSARSCSSKSTRACRKKLNWLTPIRCGCTKWGSRMKIGITLSDSHARHSAGLS
mmetsp:Transcript_31614/g.75809  ORF Transcript_31614/g.75809 Transcript_31614/m.75809 type:complete len:254 (+) Transcript_31614:868-1629(+)